MAFRLIVLLTAATLSSAGFTAAAWSLTRSQTDQAIAFGWPAIAVAITVAILVPMGKRPGSAG